MNQPISTLNLPMNVINKLEKYGFYYCKDVAENLDTIQTKLNIFDWSLLTVPREEKTALELCEKETNWKPVTTFIPELDSVLNDQIIPGTITELTGFPGCGKTQTCLHLAVGALGEAVIIHTENNLNPNRIQEIVEKYSPNNNSIMEKLLSIGATDPVELLACVHFIENWLADHRNVKLVLIDSIAWPLKQQPFTERSNLIYSLFQKLRVLANSYNFAIVVTNHLTTRINGSDSYHTSSFGDSFHHIINNRILLSKDGNLFNAKVLKSTQTISQDHFSFKFQNV